MSYLNLMVTTKQKSKAETQNIQKGKTQKQIIEYHQLTKVNKSKKKEWREKIIRRQQGKMAVKSLHIITLTKQIELTNEKAQSGWMDKKRPNFCLQETHFRSKDTHLSEEREDDISSKQKAK